MAVFLESLNQAKKLLRVWIGKNRTPTAEFVDWCKNATGTVAEAPLYHLSTSTANQGGDPISALSILLSHVNSAIQSGAAFGLILNQPIDKQEIRLVGNFKSEPKTDVANLQFNNAGRASVHLEHLTIELLEIYGSPITLELVNCRVAKVVIHSDPMRFISKHTSFGLVHLLPLCIHYLDVTGGCVLNFDCPAAGSDNPFTGHVYFAPDVFLPKDTKNYLLESAQPYRNLRHHLRALHNTNTANLFHAAELTVERERGSWTENLVSRLYEYFTDFGNSILRPFLWWLLLIAATTLCALHSDGGLVAADPTAKPVGWPVTSDLYADNELAVLIRASYASLSAAINPFGLFGSKSLLIAQSPWLAAILTAEQILSAVLITLIIFAIRRRFKIQQE